jgi:hypothetical protein
VGTSSVVVGAPELNQGQEVVLILNRLDDFGREADLTAPVTPFRLA